MKLYGYLAVSMVALTGCIKTDYELELTPADHALQRKLKILRHGAEKPDEIEEDVARLAQEYGVKVPVANNEQTFRGEFASKLPNDIGGWGRFARFDSPFGSAMVYLERFRGSNDLVGLLERKQAAANLIADLAIGWLETELGNDPGWPQLRRFLDEPFRRDVFNLGLLAWRKEQNFSFVETNSVMGALLWPIPLESDDAHETLVTEIVQYLMERGYFTMDDVPKLMRIHLDETQTLRMFQQAVATQLGYPDDRSPEFDFLKSGEAFTASLSQFLQASAGFQNLVMEYGRDVGSFAETENLIQGIMLLFSNLMFGNPEGFSGRLTVTLKTHGPPTLTNGVWAEDTKETRWPKEVLPFAHHTSRVIYALWEEPNPENQRKHFGAVVLDGDALIGYCVWYRGLTDDERGQWDAFVEMLTPGPDLVSQLTAFRFRGESDDVDSELRLSAAGVEGILNGLSQ